MRKKRIYKPQQKAQAVLQVLSGTKSAAQVCRDLNINENLLSRWKQQLLTHAARVFECNSEATEKDEQIADLQRLFQSAKKRYLKTTWELPMVSMMMERFSLLSMLSLRHHLEIG